MEYTITSTQNPVIKTIKKLSLAKERKRSGLFLAEGEKCVQEALKISSLCVQLLVLDDDKERYQYLTESFAGDIFWVTAPVLESMASTKTPQGIMAICDSTKLDLKENEGLIVVLDGVSDPGNVGTIIRTADAAGASAVYTIGESADILSPKVLRASMGSVFHIPVRHIDLNEIIALKDKGYTVLGADLSGDTRYTVSGNKQCLVIGSEAHGISKETLQLVDKAIKIPIYGEAESLNAGVAAGILIYRITEILHQ